MSVDWEQLIGSSVVFIMAVLLGWLGSLGFWAIKGPAVVLYPVSFVFCLLATVLAGMAAVLIKESFE